MLPRRPVGVRGTLTLDGLGPARAVCELFGFLEDVVFWIKDPAGRYCWANVANLLNLGLNRREDVVGKTDCLRGAARTVTSDNGHYAEKGLYPANALAGTHRGEP